MHDDDDDDDNDNDNSVRCDVVNSYGYVLHCVESITYLGVHFVRAKHAVQMLQRHFIAHLTQYLAELAEVVLKKSF